MASATPDLRLPSPPQGSTVRYQLLEDCACAKLPKVLAESETAVARTCDLNDNDHVAENLNLPQLKPRADVCDDESFFGGEGGRGTNVRWGHARQCVIRPPRHRPGCSTQKIDVNDTQRRRSALTFLPTTPTIPSHLSTYNPARLGHSHSSPALRDIHQLFSDSAAYASNIESTARRKRDCIRKPMHSMLRK